MGSVPGHTPSFFSKCISGGKQAFANTTTTNNNNLQDRGGNHRFKDSESKICTMCGSQMHPNLNKLYILYIYKCPYF